MDDHSLTVDSVTPVEACKDLIKFLLSPSGWTKYKCGKMVRSQGEIGATDGYTLHFHSKGRLRPWHRKIYLESHLTEFYHKLTREQAIYIMGNHPKTYSIAMYWLVETYPEFK